MTYSYLHPHEPNLKISVIAPCLNESKYIPYLFKSVHKQCYDKKELIIVDGGSTDGSLEIAKNLSSDYNDNFKTTIISENSHNMGAARNIGSEKAVGDVLFHTNTDVDFLHDEDLFWSLAWEYVFDSNVVAVAGATNELNTCVRTKISYEAYHILRWLMANSPHPIKRYSPSGNFFTIRKETFWDIGGFPECHVNEDGYFGRGLAIYNKNTGKRMIFKMGLRVNHNPGRFKNMGWSKAIQYYFYILPNIFPFLDNHFSGIYEKASNVYKQRLFK